MNIKRNIIFTLESRKKDGVLITENVPIRMRVNFASKRIEFTTGYRIDATKWDADKQRVKNGCSNKLKQSASEINASLLEYYTEIQDIFKRFEVVDIMPTPNRLRRLSMFCTNLRAKSLSPKYRELNDADDIITDVKLNIKDLNMMGIVGIEDPVRKDVPDAIEDCLNAGIQVKIVTRDAPGTAKEIGRQLGLWKENDTDENILMGTELAAMSDEELKKRLPKVKIISRARPNDKERAVRILKELNYIVAVTGDGTNDAPALNAANVGLSMGDGTAVAKEASDMTIIDNSFCTIANAVMWGRSLYKNIKRFILFQMTVNVAACLIVLIGAFIGEESPLTVTQMLWVNLIMDTFAALALASLPPTKTVMEEKPRSVDEHILKGMGTGILGVGGIFTAILLGICLYFQHTDITSLMDIFNGSTTWGANNGLSAYELGLFFTIFVMLQFWNLFNAKAFMTSDSAFRGISWKEAK